MHPAIRVYTYCGVYLAGILMGTRTGMLSTVNAMNELEKTKSCHVTIRKRNFLDFQGRALSSDLYIALLAVCWPVQIISNILPEDKKE